MAIADLLRILGVNPVYRNRVVHIDVTVPSEARYGLLGRLFLPRLQHISNRKKSVVFSSVRGY